MSDIRATPAQPYQGQPTWRGEYLHEGKWHVVKNRFGGAIAYASEKSALNGAALTLENERTGGNGYD
jgi:hypothetical protein